MSKAPAFQFYTGDWLSSTAITLMTPAEEGGYIRLLSYMWNDPDCGLPDDPEKLTILSRLTSNDKGVIGTILACFEKHPTKKGFLTNKRLLAERKKQDEWRQHQRESGKKGMESRWKGGDKDHNKPITSLLQDYNPSSSSSSLDSSFKDLKTTPSRGKRKTHGKPTENPKVIEIPDWIDREAWNGFMDMRTKIKAPLTERAKDLLINKLDKFRESGQDATTVLNQSVLNSWKSVYPVKKDPPTPPDPDSCHVCKRSIYEPGVGMIVPTPEGMICKTCKEK